MFHLILYEPEIPPNTGSVIRLCANVGASLHLVHPLGFRMDVASLRRAGLDYHELANVVEHKTLTACIAQIKPQRIYALSTKGTGSLFKSNFLTGDAFVLGPETRGLPKKVLLFILAIAFGRSLTTLLKRLPNPPARINTTGESSIQF